MNLAKEPRWRRQQVRVEHKKNVISSLQNEAGFLRYFSLQQMEVSVRREGRKKKLHPIPVPKAEGGEKCVLLQAKEGGNSRHCRRECAEIMNHGLYGPFLYVFCLKKLLFKK